MAVFYDDGGSKHLQNVSKLLLEYMALQPGRQPPSGGRLYMFTANVWTVLCCMLQFNDYPLKEEHTRLNLAQYTRSDDMFSLIGL
jgi:hypothetical protein